MRIIRAVLLTALASFVASAVGSTVVSAQQQRTNIVIIWGDDIGQSNISAYSRGLMGYQTPNIDRVANEGMMFTDYYAEQSCTAGRASFITGQSGPTHRDDQGWLARRYAWTSKGRSNHRRIAQTTGLCDWPVRQEP